MVRLLLLRVLRCI